jgi:hypothetical protein
MEELRAKFLRTYANIPLNLRDDIVLVLDDGPISWKVAFIEVATESKKSEIILQKLNELSII